MTDPLRSRMNEIDREFAGFLAGRCGSWPLEDEWNPMSGIDYLDAVLLKERARADRMETWALIFAFAAFMLMAAWGLFFLETL